MDRVMRALVLLALVNGCGNSNTGDNHDMATPDDLSMAADLSMENQPTVFFQMIVSWRFSNLMGSRLRAARWQSIVRLCASLHPFSAAAKSP